MRGIDELSVCIVYMCIILGVIREMKLKVLVTHEPYESETHDRLKQYAWTLKDITFTLSHPRRVKHRCNISLFIVML